ncbi:hypothetical protein L6164_028415 [Bauhinia variegata]|uniref:Uncharacterized protein n=1 Tax=Bauhinia variegata TaxID=167791 RepID=A0ACB9L6M6_BAUVA|nr:hypothetical protein L6164_028415 [Bauhinia variegata]
MASFEATGLVMTKIKNFDPENASKIMGYLLMSLEDGDLVRLACSPDHVLHSIFFRVKSHLGLSSNISSTPSPLSPLNPIARPSSSNPFSQSSPRIANNDLDFTRNQGSPSSSSHAWPLSGFPSNPISPKSSPLLSYEDIRAGAVPSPSFSPRVNGDCYPSSDFVEGNQMGEYFSFLNESVKNEDLVDPRLELGHGVPNWPSINNGIGHFHKRSYSASEVPFGADEVGSPIGSKTCLYFARGFCKNGNNCKFAHSVLTDSPEASSGSAIVGSPSRFEWFQQQRDEFMRLKAVQKQRLAALQAQHLPGGSSSASEKYFNFLMQQHNSDPQRAAAAAALMISDEFNQFERCRPERNEFLAIAAAEKPNSASRQIYLTFPAESTFKDEDVSEYFSKFGPVQDVRIPYQQKRMFGFVTFVYPETVKTILAKGNPHFICDSRVLVKPYKEKGKIPEKRQHQQQQVQLDRGDFSPSLNPSGFDYKETYDIQLGPRMFYNPHELLRRKFEEQAELQQAIELQGRRLMNLQLPDFKNNHMQPHQRSLSVGAPLPLPQHRHSHIGNSILSSDSIKEDITSYSSSLSSTIALPTAAAELQPLQQEVNSTSVLDHGSGRRMDSSVAEVFDLHNSVEQVLPDTLFASPTKGAGDNQSNVSLLPEVNKSSSFPTSTPCENKLEPAAASTGMASH